MIGGQPVAVTASSSPQRRRAATPGGWIIRVDSVSLGNVAWSTSSTRWPMRASSIARGAPAQRAPTTSASYGPVISILLHVDGSCRMAWTARGGIGEVPYRVPGLERTT